MYVYICLGVKNFMAVFIIKPKQNKHPNNKTLSAYPALDF